VRALGRARGDLDFGEIIFAIFSIVFEKFTKKCKPFEPPNLKTKSGGREWYRKVREVEFYEP